MKNQCFYLLLLFALERNRIREKAQNRLLCLALRAPRSLLVLYAYVPQKRLLCRLTKRSCSAYRSHGRHFRFCEILVRDFNHNIT